jgi:hypothetical protein
MTRKRKRITLAPVNLGHVKADIMVDRDVDNPLFKRAHAGARWNPAKIDAARNMRESTFSALAGRKVLDHQQIAAARKFLGYYEAVGGSGAQAIDYSREPVDGGGAREAISDRQVDAGIKLKEAAGHLGHRAYSIVERVIGDGYTIAQISTNDRSKRTNADYLKDALDDLAALWGINRPVNFTKRVAVYRA